MFSIHSIRNKYLLPALVLGATMLPVPRLSRAEEPSETRITEQQRQDIVRAFTAENCFVHRTLPMGKVGLRIVDGKITPGDDEVKHLAAQYGPAARPGDRAQITLVKFVRDGILFEINGGPVKRKKWYERIQISGAPVAASSSQSGTNDVYNNARGSYVLLGFKGKIPSLSTDQVRDLLSPILDFKARTVAEAYTSSLPPLLQQAVKEHRPLVGMDKEMVTYTLGSPPRRTRERDERGDYEEWIYGEPPKEVQFVRFHGDKVTQIEVMTVDGEKLVRNRDEVGNLGGAVSASAKNTEAARPEPAADPSAPSLMRPGEAPAMSSPQGRDSSPRPVDPGTPDPQGTSQPH